MGWTDSIPDMQGLERYFRSQVPGDPSQWRAVWASWAEQAEQRRAYCVEDPDEWPAEVETITRALRQGMSAGQGARRTAKPGREGKDAASTDLAAHQMARSIVLAEHAGADPEVLAFRSDWLGSGVRTTDDEVREWAAGHVGEVVVRWTTEAGSTEELYLAEDIGRPLQKLVERLARAYRWAPALAAAFVLAGAVPHSPMLRVRCQVSHGGRRGTASDLITLRVHPDVPARDVEAAYRAAQSEEWGTRAHLIGERVADAVLKSATVPGGPRAQNEAMERPYGDAGDFRRTVERAKHRLMGNPAPMKRDDFRRALLGRHSS